MADEWLPDDWGLPEARQAAPRLAYLSVMGGTYESFLPPTARPRRSARAI
ncbi:hypothetical protein DFAR_1520002 [Desulfarculales bacterium]